ncbi:MAG: CCA tRNA nucleotidyltransferase [Oscillospiraceae bacterium]|nr:CCA tRNA nucleotidyltransferase [Oscillospiraceae bacterium]
MDIKKQMEIKIPSEATYIIETLENSGFAAYVVGGCVRDCILGKEPGDWDICTSAPPEQSLQIFSGEHIIETGLCHGTITLVLNGSPFEITTFRKDGAYSDNRRPDSVEFVSELKSDLSRRDFTINAMAYSKKEGIIDYFGGSFDLQNKLVRCVGDADRRFCEDALRIMRALRFASTLGFAIEKNTAEAMEKNKKLLGNIAAERIARELNLLLLGQGAKNTMASHNLVISEILPEAEPIGSGHFAHVLDCISAAPPDLAIRLSMFFCSRQIAKKALMRLKSDNATISEVECLVLHRNAPLCPDRINLKRWLNRLGERMLKKLIEAKKAEAMVGDEKCRQAMLNEISLQIDTIIGQRQCYSLKDLAINGRDLIDAGVKEGPLIGEILGRLLDMVIDEQVENEKSALINEAPFPRSGNMCSEYERSSYAAHTNR